MPSFFHRTVDWINEVGRVGIGQQAQIDDPDIKLIFVINGELDALNHIGVRAATFIIEDANAEQIGFGRNPPIILLSSDQKMIPDCAGNMCTVTITVPTLVAAPTIAITRFPNSLAMARADEIGLPFELRA